MAGKGGGAWKVAYADFVTAMMAFFLVMWITAQDQKVKQAVSYYFMDPVGNSKKSAKAGSVAPHPETGSVTHANEVAMGKGRNTHIANGEPSPSTKAVNDWLAIDKEARQYWLGQANQARDAAARSPEVKNKTVTEIEEATNRLSRQMKEELKSGVPAKNRGIYQELLTQSLNDVNWNELAEDLLKN